MREALNLNLIKPCMWATKLVKIRNVYNNRMLCNFGTDPNLSAVLRCPKNYRGEQHISYTYK